MDKHWLIPFVVASSLALAGCYTQFGTMQQEESSDQTYDDQNNANPADTTESDYTDQQYQQDRDQFYYPSYYYSPAYASPWNRPGFSLWYNWDSYDPWYYYPYYTPGWYYPYSGYGSTVMERVSGTATGTEADLATRGAGSRMDRRERSVTPG